MLARCPSCRNTFSTDHGGRQNCPSCGKPLLVPEPGPTLQAEIVSDSPPPSLGTPWERRAELGLWSGWLQTIKQALLEPNKLFTSAQLDRGPAQLGFAILTASVCSAVGQLLSVLISGDPRAARQQALQMIPDDSPAAPMMHRMVELLLSPPTVGRVLLPILAAPLVWLVVLYLNAAVTHGVAVLIGQSKRGFAATFAACAYSFAPLALCALPTCGSGIGALWLIVLTGVGMKATHRISSGGAAASVLLPYLLCCCLGVAATVAGAAMLGKAMGAP